MNIKKIAFCLQVRSNSSRLKRKAFIYIKSKFLFLFCYYRIKKIFPDSHTWVLTSNNSKDDTLCQILKRFKINFFRGSLDNVVSRYNAFLNKYLEYDHVVRFTADNPIFSDRENKRLLFNHLQKKYDYSSNLDSLPKGKGVDIFSRRLIFDSSKNTNKINTIHLNSYILKNKKKYKVNILPKSFNRSSFTIDTKDDLNKILKMFSNK